MSALAWRRTARGNYVADEYLIMWIPQESRRLWILYHVGKVLIECDRLGAAKQYAQRHREGMSEQ